jgi:predicted SprT family Zn-dependent metalloprotease
MPFQCDFCGKTVDDARHVCTKMLDKIEYICKKCGRLAIYDSLLCEPYPVDTD